MVFQSIATPSAELKYVSDRDGGFKRPLERRKLLPRWAFEYFDQNASLRTRGLCSGSPIAEPVPRRRVFANFENAPRIRAFDSVRIGGHDTSDPTYH